MSDKDTQAFCDQFDQAAAILRECIELLKAHVAETDYQVACYLKPVPWFMKVFSL